MSDLMKLWSCLILIFLVCSCSSRKIEPVAVTAAPPRFDFEREAIRLNLTADPQMHLFQGSPHTLLLCLYQLSDPNAFTQKSESRDGLTELLQCERFDPSVTSSRRIILQPGGKTTILLDRTEGTRELGLIAGYYSMVKEQMVRHYPIPIEVEKKTNISRPKKLEVNIVFGPQQINPTLE